MTDENGTIRYGEGWTDIYYQDINSGLLTRCSPIFTCPTTLVLVCACGQENIVELYRVAVSEIQVLQFRGRDAADLIWDWGRR